MLGKSQQLSKQIAQTVFRQVPSGWASAQMIVKMISSRSETRSNYVPQEGGPSRHFKVHYEIDKLWVALRESMYEDVGAAWYVAILTLTPDGKFRFQYDYDDLSQFSLTPTPAAIASDLKRFPRTNPADDEDDEPKEEE